MLKGDWLPGFAVVLILLFAAWVGLGIGYQDGYGDGGDDATAYQQDGAISGGSLSKSGITDKQTERNEWRDEEDLRAQRNMADWAAWVFAASAAGVLITGLGVIFIAQTLKSTREAADFAARTLTEATNATQAATDTIEVMRDTTYRELRAYVAIISCEQFHKDANGRRAVSIYVTFRNCGQTPADAVTYCAAMRILDGENEEIEKIVIRERNTGVNLGPSVEQTIKISAPLPDWVLNGVDRQAVISRLAVVGRIEYLDFQAEEIQTTRFDYVAPKPVRKTSIKKRLGMDPVSLGQNEAT